MYIHYITFNSKNKHFFCKGLKNMIKMPTKPQYVIDTLVQNGHSAYIVGGCVRDSLMGKTPDDFDITTSAKPEEVQNLFAKTVPTGIKHGTVTVIVDKTTIEVTTFRTESGYSDSRHPENVSFVSSIKEDLSRRDFTVNAIAYNKYDGIADFFGGCADINNKILRAVGEPEKRFREDALRILRLFRFASTLGFACEDNTLAAALHCSDGLLKISHERIFTELYKSAKGENFKVIKPLIESKALSFLKITNLPDFEKIKKADSSELSFFMFLHFSSDNILETLELLKVSNKLKNYCIALEKMLKNDLPQTKANLKMLLCKFDAEYIKDYLKLKSILDSIDTSIQISLLTEIISNGEPYLISHLKISGETLQNLGYTGKQIGKILKELQKIAIQNPEQNEQDILIEKLNEFPRN